MREEGDVGRGSRDTAGEHRRRDVVGSGHTAGEGGVENSGSRSFVCQVSLRIEVRIYMYKFVVLIHVS